MSKWEYMFVQQVNGALEGERFILYYLMANAKKAVMTSMERG